MTALRRLTDAGLEKFQAWLLVPEGVLPPESLLNGDLESEIVGDAEIELDIQFSSRYSLGEYLVKKLQGHQFVSLMSPVSDGIWAWLAVVFFKQLTEKGIRRSEHYVVARRGLTGSLAYRHAIRSSFELVYIHGPCAQICLQAPMHTFGDMAEQLASRQTIAHNRGFFQAAFDLYFKDGKLRRGASSKPKKPKERQPGDRSGFGSIRRLAIALQRLDLTYDTGVMPSKTLVSVLPREFSKWQD
jgi:hypothetical protein